MILQAKVKVDIAEHGRLFRRVFNHAVLEGVAARVVDLESASLISEELRFGAGEKCVDAVGRELGAIALSSAGDEADGDSGGGGVR